MNTIVDYNILPSGGGFGLVAWTRGTNNMQHAPYFATQEQARAWADSKGWVYRPF